ncbi:MAG: hypothetical protein ABSD13_05635 [Candidatus Korobacteraceae bacterium]|jgi:hypothetical protein
MISSDEAFIVFRKWADEQTPLRFDATMPGCSISVEGTLETAGNELTIFRVRDLGVIEVHLPLGAAFEYCDPDAMRIDPAARIAEGYNGDAASTGSALCAVTQRGDKFLFLETTRS